MKTKILKILGAVFVLAAAIFVGYYNFYPREEIVIDGVSANRPVKLNSDVTVEQKLSQNDMDLKEYMKKRCPFNHMTVMYKRSSVIDAGNYQDWFWNEDYYLWIRMALKGHRFTNIPETLVNVRVGSNMYARRGGEKYFKSEIGIQKLMLEKGIISKPTYVCNYIKRLVIQKLLPNNVRAWVYRRFARS